MTTTFFKHLLQLFLLLVLQVFIFNNVQIFGYATPMICIYLILQMSLATPHWQVLLWAFVIGVLEDIFTNTPGMSAASLTFIALIQPSMLKLLASKDFVENEECPEPSAQNMRWWPFIRYVFICILIEQALFYIIEAFNFFNYNELLINIGGGTITSLLIIIAMECIRPKKASKQ